MWLHGRRAMRGKDLKGILALFCAYLTPFLSPANEVFWHISGARIDSGVVIMRPADILASWQQLAALVWCQLCQLENIFLMYGLPVSRSAAPLIPGFLQAYKTEIDMLHDRPIPPSSAFAMLNGLRGVLLLGTLIQEALLGLLLGQTLALYRFIPAMSSPTLSGVQLTVPSLMLLNAVQSIIQFFSTWKVLLGELDAVDSLARANIGRLEPGLTAVIIMVTHTFFIRRCWILSNRSWTVLLSVSCCSLFASTAGLGASAVSPDLNGRDIPQRITLGIWLSCTAGTDVIITIITTYTLVAFSRNSLTAQTTSILRRWIWITLQNGLVTTLAALINMVLYFTLKHPMYQ
ncbi:hypothetical protein DFH06DRAFT_1480498 [Mycena polygramma]|nr:hypothetical protein DFH06DRAFT_1480498 [Mycena polygramma]